MVVKPLCRTSCVGTDNVELAALTADLFRALAFVGMGSLEVKYDLDGRPWITEPTVGRPNLQSYSAFAQHVLKVHRVSGAYGSRWDPVPLIGLIWSSARNAWTALPKT